VDHRSGGFAAVDGGGGGRERGRETGPDLTDKFRRTYRQTDTKY